MEEGIRVCALKGCPDGRELWVFNGNIIRSYRDLVKSLEKQDEFTFRYHVNDDNQKNDFAKWVIDVIGDRELGNRLLRIQDRNEYAEAIRQRIREIEMS